MIYLLLPSDTFHCMPFLFSSSSLQMVSTKYRWVFKGMLQEKRKEPPALCQWEGVEGSQEIVSGVLIRRYFLSWQGFYLYD